MTVEITRVERVKGRTIELVAWIGNIEFRYIRLPETGEPYEEVRMKHGSQVLDREGLHVPEKDYRDLQRRVHKVFSEVRAEKPRLRKKRIPEALQGKLL